MLGMAEQKALVDKFNTISARFAEELTDDEMTALITEQGEVQEQIDNADAWDLERKAGIAIGCFAPSASGFSHRQIIRW